MGRQRAPKTTVLNLSRAWKIQAAIEHLFDTLTTLVPPNPMLHWAMKAFGDYQVEFHKLEAIDSPKIQTQPGIELVDREG